ncbi:hypothetical protein [Corallococcus sp. RDP092CA]|uniref:hypothetical protein n=1 Tax=Corallococcus sp. RDP092CA TaxID=3109369 RepID=UPI0035B3C4BD
MNRLLALVVPLALLMGTGCVVEAHSHRPVRRVAYVAPAPVVEYRFAGAHPIPDDYGGGWCPEDYAHVHDYQPPTTSYVYTDNVYYYRGPTVVWYWDYHPIPGGGYCNLHGRHQHDFYPHGSWGAGYSYDRGSGGYRWSNSHQASPVASGRNNIAPSRPAPAPAPAPAQQGRNPPPGGTGTGARPPSGAGWGRGNVAPSNNARDNDRKDNDRGNSGGWNTPASKSRDDDKDNNRGSSGSSGRSSGGWDTSGSSNGSSGSSGRSSGSSSGSSGGGWNTGRGSGSSSSGNSGSRW